MVPSYMICNQFKVLSSLHPTPAVCGFPTEEARILIAETGNYVFQHYSCSAIYLFYGSFLLGIHEMKFFG